MYQMQKLSKVRGIELRNCTAIFVAPGLFSDSSKNKQNANNDFMQPFYQQRHRDAITYMADNKESRTTTKVTHPRPSSSDAVLPPSKKSKRKDVDDQPSTESDVHDVHDVHDQPPAEPRADPFSKVKVKTNEEDDQLSRFANSCRSCAVLSQISDLDAIRDSVEQEDAELALMPVEIPYPNCIDEPDASGSASTSSSPTESKPNVMNVCIGKRILFPSRLDTDKQIFMLATNVVVQRWQTVDQHRFNETISWLKKGHYVAWIGHDGIGKSTEANFLLMTFLSKIGEAGWPPMVLYRVNDCVYKFTELNGVIKCKKKEVEGLNELKKYCRKLEKKATDKGCMVPVLFLELSELETNPTSSIPTFIAVSARDVLDTTLKTMEKSQGLHKFTVRPHSLEELQTVARLMFRFDHDAILERFGLSQTASEDEVVQVVNQRVAKVGCLIRIVFTHVHQFREQVKRTC
jgi:hypothetical protein